MGHVCQPRPYRRNLSSWLPQWLSSWTVQLALGSVSKETIRFPGLTPPFPEKFSYRGQRKVGIFTRVGAARRPGADVRNPAGGGEQRPGGLPSKGAPSRRGDSEPVLVCSGRHNNTPQNGRLQQRLFLTVPESGKFKMEKLTEAAVLAFCLPTWQEQEALGCLPLRIRIPS